MGEEEAGLRYLRPLVKQDLSKLDSDGESRRLALKSLKQFIEQLDATSMPKFLSQIDESRESGASRSYAISLYEEVARVHRKLIKPHLPRVMSSVIRALAASGSSPQLQQACAKVTAAMARYTIDPTLSIKDAEDIIRAICDPLTEVLTGKLEPVAAGAAACIHALIETENWKYASDETIQAVCQRITVALSDKSTRTVIHLQLASALSSMNPDTLSLYGAALMRIAEETLKNAVDSWQHRKAAVKLLQGVLIILDKATLETEVDLAIHALESCRLDRMPLVRVAVGEALYAAKMLSSSDSGVLSSPLCKSICKSMEQQNAWTKRDMEPSQSSWTKESDSLSTSPIQKRIVSPTSQESNQLSFSPASTSTTESIHNSKHIILTQAATMRNNSQRSRQTQALFPNQGFNAPSSRCSSPGILPPSGSISDDGEFIIPQKLDAKENIPARITNANGALPSEEVQRQVLQVQTKATNLRVSMPLPDAYDPLISNLALEKFAHDIHTPESKDRNNFAEKLTVDRAVPHANCMMSRHMMSPTVSAILDELTKTASSILAEDDAGLALFDSQIEEACNLKPSFRNGILPQLHLEINFDSSDHSQFRNSGYDADNSNQSFLHRNENHLDVRDANECVEHVETRDINLVATDTIEDSAPQGHQRSDEKSVRVNGPHNSENIDLKHHYNAFTHLDFSPEKSQSLIPTKDFLPFATPKRLMRTLQSMNSDSNPDSKRVSLNEDVALCQHDAVVPGVVDMDVEASSEAGWSVRDNPIASHESFQADTSDDELEDRLKLPFSEDHAQPNQNNFVSGTDPQRDVHMLSPVHSSESILTNSIPTQATHNYIKCDILCSELFNSHVHMSISGEGGRSYSPVAVEDSKGGAHILADPKDEIGKRGLRCNCLAMTTVDSSVKGCYRQASPEQNHRQSWWDGGRFMLLQLMSSNWKNNLCWYGEIILGGTLCVVLTLPLAMALVKALFSTSEHLVPT